MTDQTIAQLKLEPDHHLFEEMLFPFAIEQCERILLFAGSQRRDSSVLIALARMARALSAAPR